MINNLSRLSAYTCVSLLGLNPMKGYDGVVESDITRLKRGIRCCNSLNEQEGYYRALVNASLLTSFQVFSDVMTHINFFARDLKLDIRHFKSQADHREHLASIETDQDEAKHHLEQADVYLRMAEAYRILDSVSADAEKILKDIPTNRSGNIEWKDLKSVQFYAYNPETNSFVEVNEKGKRV